jgi:hypothetical protein
VSARQIPFIDAPLVLVSQIARSGGSLLAQLFDGHPQVYAHPFEIRIWHPEKPDWPELDPAGDPSAWFDALDDEKWVRLTERGFAKTGRNPHASEIRYAFTLSVDEQRLRFLELVESRAISRQRDILDCFLTSFFASWQEWEPTGRERLVTGFMPDTATRPGSVERFRRDYPDGKLITIVRDPRSWYASSAVTHYRREGVAPAVAEWLHHARLVRERVSGPDAWVRGILFDDLVLEPETTMRGLASFVGIDFDPCLLQPSYLGQPLLPNSSFAVSTYGINPAMARRGDEISPEAHDAIAAEALPLYEELVELVGARARAGAGRHS